MSDTASSDDGTYDRSRPPMLVQRGDLEYQSKAQAESEFWARANHLFGIEATSPNAPLDFVDRYSNRRLTGNPTKRWYEEIARYGPFRRGLALGASGVEQDARILELNPGLHLTAYDISAAAAARWADELSKRYPGRVEAFADDLNFIELPGNSYDLIVSSATLHHIVNLEHLAYQINRALTASGRVFVQDYVGENRYRISEDKRRVFELLYNRHRARMSMPASDLRWPDEHERNISPFCGVRSEEMLGVLAQYLEPLQVRTASALVVLLLLVEYPSGWKYLPTLRNAMHRVRLKVLRQLGRHPLTIEQRFVEELALVGDILSDTGILAPGDSFGIYGKRG